LSFWCQIIPPQIIDLLPCFIVGKAADRLAGPKRKFGATFDIVMVSGTQLSGPIFLGLALHRWRIRLFDL